METQPVTHYVHVCLSCKKQHGLICWAAKAEELTLRCEICTYFCNDKIKAWLSHCSIWPTFWIQNIWSSLPSFGVCRMKLEEIKKKDKSEGIKKRVREVQVTRWLSLDEEEEERNTGEQLKKKKYFLALWQFFWRCSKPITPHPTADQTHLDLCLSGHMVPWSKS